MKAPGSYSDRRLLIFVLPLVLAAAVLAGIGSLPAAHGAGYPGGPGLVCLNDASAAAAPPANPCPSTPYTFDGPYPFTPQLSPTQIRVGVYVNGSAGLNGFDITLLTSHTVLSPVGIDLTGTVLTGAPTIVVECLSGILVSGSNCFGSDTVNTVHFAATSQPGSPVSPSPTSGLLFTAIYGVVGTAPLGGVSLAFQTGCLNTSVAGGVCVTITNGTTSPNAETVQVGTSFDNSLNTVPWLAETSNSSIIVVVKGASLGNQVTITLTAENGWPSLSTDSINFRAVATNGFTAPILSMNTCSPATCTITATFNTGKAGTYSSTIYGSYIAFDSNGLTMTLVAPVTIQVTVQDVAWTINNVPYSSTQTDYMATTAPLQMVFTATSLGGYSGTLTYSTNFLSDGGTGITFAYPATFTISPGATVTKLVNTNAAAQGTVLYQPTLSATGLAIKNSAALTIKVSGFTLATNSTSLSFNAGKSSGVSITATSLGDPSSNGFSGPVTISKTVTGPGKLTVTCNSPLTLIAGGSVSGTCSFTGSTAGTYSVTITGTGGTNNAVTNSTSVSVTILSVAGFSLAASPTSMTTNAGTAGVSTITVNSSGSFNQPVSITAIVYPSAIICTITPTSITPPAGSTATSALSCSGPAGVYTVTLTAASTGSASKTATITYKVQDYTLTASSPTLVIATQSTTSTITITALDGFSGTVTLTANPSVGLSATLSPISITGGSSTSTLTASSATAGNYTVTVTGTSGLLSHTTGTIFVQVVDFQIFANPTMLSTTPGVQVTSSLMVTPVNGFTGSVELTLTVAPTAGLSCSVSPISITGSGTSALACSGTGGTYTVTVGGTSASVSHSAIATVNVQDFQLTTSPGSIVVAEGGCTSNTASAISLGGFMGTVALTASTPSGLTSTLTPTTIVNAGTSTAMVCAATTTPTGSYLVIVTGASGSVIHQATLSVTVSPGTTTPPPMLTQATWNHRFSLAKYNDVMTFKLGVQNPSAVTEYVNLRVIAIDSTGVDGFILNSQVIALSPGQNTNQILLTQSFTSSQVGETFTFNISIQWGLTATTDPSQLAFNSTASNGQPTAGSFTVLP